MTYAKALAESRRVGASKATGLPYLAQTILVLALAHAINPKLTYNGAVKTNLTGDQVSKLGPVELGDLMFV